jgi:hypothetical protein
MTGNSGTLLLCDISIMRRNVIELTYDGRRELLSMFNVDLIDHSIFPVQGRQSLGIPVCISGLLVQY